MLTTTKNPRNKKKIIRIHQQKMSIFLYLKKPNIRIITNQQVRLFLHIHEEPPFQNCISKIENRIKPLELRLNIEMYSGACVALREIALQRRTISLLQIRVQKNFSV